MAKKMRRLLALLLALALVGGQMILPALAAGDPGTPADPEVTITLEEDGTQTTTTTYTDPDTGAEVTIVQTRSTDEETNITTDTTSTQTVQTTQGSNRTDVNTTWESTQVQTGTETEGTNPVTTTDTNVTTVVEGEENSTESVRVGDTVTIVEGQLSGQETTTITGTTVITTTEQGVTTDSTTDADPTQTSGQYSEAPEITDNGYIPGREHTGQWELTGEDRPGTGTRVDKDTDTDTETLKPEYEGTVKLEMTAGGTDKEVIEITDLSQLTDEDLENATVTPKYKNGEIVSWTVTYDKQVTTESKIVDTDITGDWVDAGSPREAYIDPGKYVPGTTVTGDDLDAVEEGRQITTVIEPIYNNGVFEGYRIITTTVDKSTAPTTDEAVGTRTDYGYEIQVGDPVSTGYTMPEEPEPSVTENEDGSTTTVSYTLIEEDGQPRGYTIVTETLDANGELVHREVRNIYGTAHSSQTTVETDPTAERTTATTLVTRTDVQEIRTIETIQPKEKVEHRVDTYKTTIVEQTDTYEIINTDAGTFFIYEGRMYQVQAIGTHGDADVQTLTPDGKYITAQKGSDLRNKNGTSTGLFSNYSNASNDDHPDGYEFRYVGNGAASTLKVQQMNGSSTANHQFALRDSDGNLHYVYCCDLNTSAIQGSYYEIENLKDAGYYSTAEGSDIVDHIRTVATNGFWATSGGANTTGSLEAVKALLRKYGYNDVANSITEGEALTATQAALWNFGNRGSKPNPDNIVAATKTNGAASNSTDERNVRTLYELLISDKLKNATADTSTDLIDKEDITGGSITVHEQVGQTAQGAVYNTDVAFELKVEYSSLTGNLVAAVYQNGKRVSDKVQIATDHSNFLGKAVADNRDGTTTVTFEGLELIEGVEFTIQLEGTQNMEEGVYLYTAQGGSNASQTFVGVASGERDVDLQVAMKFNVSDPQVKHTSKTTTTVTHDEKSYERLSTREDRKVNTETTRYGDTRTDVSYDIDIISTVTTTETKSDITKADRNWEAYWKHLFVTVEEDDDGDTIEDELVPLADAPRTGDISGLWAAISAVSLAGVAFLSVRRKEEA